MRDGTVLGVTPSHAYVFTPATNRWTPTRPPPYRLFFPMLARLPHGKVLIFGGCHPRTFTRSDKAAVYHPRTGRWTEVAPMVTPRNDAAVAQLSGGRVLVAGGYGPRLATPLASAEVYHPKTGRWSAAGSLSRPRANAGVARLDNHIIMVAGGSDAGRRVDLFDARSMTWQTGTPLPRPSWSPALFALPRGAVLAVGLDGKRHPNRGVMTRGVVRYRPQHGDPQHGDWVRAPHVPGRLWHTPPTAAWQGRPTVVGGAGRQCRRAVFTFRGETGWQSLAPLPAPRCTTDVAALRIGGLLAVGGFDVREGDTSAHFVHVTLRFHR